MVKKPKWECGSVERVFKQIQITEMRQRLAEVLEILLLNPSQLQNPAFSRVQNISQDSRSSFKRRRRKS